MIGPGITSTAKNIVARAERSISSAIEELIALLPEERGMAGAVRELVAMLPPQMAPVVVKACRDNLLRYPQPERSTWRLNDRPHSYGPVGYKICKGAHRLLVFGEMCKEGRRSAPTVSHERTNTGDVDVLLPLGDMIVRFVDHHELAVYNITLPKHIFFPGYVKLAVVSKGGDTFVDISGKGKGNWSLPNTLGGPPLFETILETYLVPAVNQQLGIPYGIHHRVRNFFQRHEPFRWR